MTLTEALLGKKYGIYATNTTEMVCTRVITDVIPLDNIAGFAVKLDDFKSAIVMTAAEAIQLCKKEMQENLTKLPSFQELIAQARVEATKKDAETQGATAEEAVE